MPKGILITQTQEWSHQAILQKCKAEKPREFPQFKRKNEFKTKRKEAWGGSLVRVVRCRWVRTSKAAKREKAEDPVGKVSGLFWQSPSPWHTRSQKDSICPCRKANCVCKSSRSIQEGGSPRRIWFQRGRDLEWPISAGESQWQESLFKRKWGHVLMIMDWMVEVLHFTTLEPKQN